MIRQLLSIPCPTSLKIQFARLVSSILVTVRCLFGLSSSNVRVQRSGISWELDLSEGIDLSIYLAGVFEPTTSRFIERFIKPGMVAIDIGANIGSHALPLAKLVGTEGKVYALEPTSWAFEKLSTNSSLNPDISEQLLLHQVALTDERKAAPSQFAASWKLNDKGINPDGIARDASSARTLTLDEFVLELELSKIDFVKLDVDGFELEILSGGKSAFTQYKPLLIIELCPRVQEAEESLAKLLETLTNLGYLLYDEYGESLLPTKLDELLALIPEQGSLNAICKYEGLDY